LNIRQRLYLGFASVLLFIGLFAWAVIGALGTLTRNTDLIGNELYQKVKYNKEIETEINVMADAVTWWVLSGDTETAERRLAASVERLEAINAGLVPLIDTYQGELLYEQSVERYITFNEGIERIRTLMSEGKRAEAQAFLQNEWEPARDALSSILEEFTAFQEKRMETVLRATENEHRDIQTIIYSGIALLIFMCLATAIGVVRGTLKTIRHIAETMRRAEPHKLDALPRMSVRPNDELSGVAFAYNRLADALEEKARLELEHTSRLETHNWVKTNVASATIATQGERDLQAYAEKLLAHVVPASGAYAGALYYAFPEQGEGRFECLAALGHGSTAERRPSFHFGEGLIGQCAVLGEPMEREAPADYVRIASGTGEADAAYLLLMPVKFDGAVVAVIELASFRPFRAQERTYLEEMAVGPLGVSLHNISNHMRIQSLLAESQQYVEELQTQSEELQQQQEELRALNEKLAEQFRSEEQRRNELERIRSELEEKARELQISSQFKSEFLANMSHELRTPLNSLLILAQMLGENPERNFTDKQREFVRTILQSGNELLALINDILDLSKIEAGQMELVEEPFSPIELAADLRRQFEGIALNKGLEHRFDVDPAIADRAYAADHQHLRQILNNLLSNAYKFTESGSVSLRVYERAAEEGRGPDDGRTWLVFEVKDTGIGIPEDKHDLIFDAFRQADGRTNRKYGGTGLGLAICRELVAMMGGTIELESEVGRGSVFTVSVPVCRKHAATAGAEAEAEVAVASERAYDDEAPGEEADPTASRGKILLVDDDIRNVYALSAALLEEQYEVVYAENGRAAIQKLGEHPDVDLVLMDMMMPEMDGYEALRQIRAMPAYAELPMIAVTAKAMKQDRELCLEAGANDYLSKPVKLDKLLTLLRVWMHGKGRDA